MAVSAATIKSQLVFAKGMTVFLKKDLVKISLNEKGIGFCKEGFLKYFGTKSNTFSMILCEFARLFVIFSEKTYPIYDSNEGK